LSFVSKRQSTIDIIYEEIKKNILELTYTPGKQLVEETLSEELGVSRTPLRHALYRLELEGLIIKKLNGRMSVTELSTQEAEELYLVREVIEGLIAREATVYIAQESNFNAIMKKFESVMFYMRTSAETNRQAEIVKYGSEFHSLLGFYSNNHTAVNMLKQINDRVSRYRRLGAYKDPTYPSITPIEEHEEILQYIKQKDPESVELLMRKHIRRSLKNTIAAFSYLSSE